RVGENGYRYYEQEAVLRLQQILFYRELGLPLEDIKDIVGRHDFDVEGASMLTARHCTGRLRV
ncbi:MAG TPA: MerR family transcriptional regulator, partial [Anaerolineales bacterium]